MDGRRLAVRASSAQTASSRLTCVKPARSVAHTLNSGNMRRRGAERMPCRPRQGQWEPHHAHRKNQYPTGRIVHGRM